MDNDANTNSKFNQILPETTDRVLCYRVNKVISLEGYQDIALPLLHTMIEKHGEIRILVDYERFLGWEEEAAKVDMMATAALGNKLAKLALINPPESEIFHRKIKGSILSGEMKIFSDFDKALEWVSS